jgi:dipeptidyl aminopeptidase/acylaminoacyl peptidase
MKRSYLIVAGILLILPLLFGMTPSGVQAGEDPYELKNYTALNLPDAKRCSFSYDGSLIVFSSTAEKKDKMESIWVANVDGTDRQMVYRNDSIEDTFSGAKFSPDGNMIVFVHVTEYISLIKKNDTLWVFV